MAEFPLGYTRSSLTIPDDIDAELDELLAEYCEIHGVTYDRDEMVGVWRGRSVSLYYNWAVESRPEDGDIRLTQDVSAPASFAGQKSLAATLLLASIGMYYVFQTTSGVSVGFAGLLLAGFVAVAVIVNVVRVALVAVDYTRHPDPLTEGLPVSKHYERYVATRPFEIATAAALAGFFLAVGMDNPLFTLGLFGGYALCAAVLHGTWVLTDREHLLDMMEQSPMAELRLSGIARRYLETIIRIIGVVLFVPAFVVAAQTVVGRYVLNADTVSQLSADAPAGLPIIDEALALVVFLWGIATLRSTSGETFKIEEFSFSQRTVSWPGRLVDTVAIVLASACIYVGLAAAFGSIFQSGLLPIPTPWVRIETTYTVAGLFALYFPAGIGYQILRRYQRTTDLLANSTEREVEVDGFTASYRAHESSEPFALAFETWSDGYIVISQGYLDLFEERPQQLAAIVAHEQGHLEHRDTRLCNAILVLSTLLLVGQNVFYAMVDFRARELAADDYAAQEVSRSAMLDALLTLSLAEFPQRTETFGANFSSHFASPADGDRISAAFGLYFGEFALHDHPGSERLRRLESSDNN